MSKISQIKRGEIMLLEGGEIQIKQKLVNEKLADASWRYRCC